jgi:hypothetical protein
MKAAFANGGTNNCIQSGAIASTRQYANLHRLFLHRCKMDFPQPRARIHFRRVRYFPEILDYHSQDIGERRGGIGISNLDNRSRGLRE